MRVYLEDVPEQYAFYVNNGRKLVNLRELAKALDEMDDTTFHHHVTQDRNDFHNWVRDIVLDLELANRLLAAKTRQEAARIVKERIKEIESATKKTVKTKVTTKGRSKK